MKACLKLRRDLLRRVHADLSRPHRYATERVGFLACQLAQTKYGISILGQDYLTVADDDYEDDPSVGAMMGSQAIRIALQYAYNHRTAMFHLHRHDHFGHPTFSLVDEGEAAHFVPDFWKVAPGLPHGTLVLSHDRIHGKWWHPRTRSVQPIDEYVTVGFPTTSHLEVYRERLE